MIYFKYKDGSRLGNWLFQYATAISLADDNAVGCIVSHENDIKLFKKYRWFDSLTFLVKVPLGLSVYEEPSFKYTPIAYSGGDLLLDGYFQSAKYFNNDKVLNRFAIPLDIEQKLTEKYDSILSCNDVTSISVRRGDYLSLPAFHPFVGKRYYCDALSCLPEVKNFIVCSDDIEWCKSFFLKNFPDRRFVFSDGNSVEEDMYLISLCKNNIICNSSFSWWGAFLNKNVMKRIIAPSRWFGLGYALKGINWDDIYLDNSEIVHNDYTHIEKVIAYMQLFWFKLKCDVVKLKRKISR